MEILLTDSVAFVFTRLQWVSQSRFPSFVLNMHLISMLLPDSSPFLNAISSICYVCVNLILLCFGHMIQKKISMLPVFPYFDLDLQVQEIIFMMDFRKWRNIELEGRKSWNL